MKDSIKKRGQKYLRKFSRVSRKAREESKEHIKENLIERVSHIQNIRLLILEWSLLVAALIMLAITQAFWSNSSYASDVFVDGGTFTNNYSSGFGGVIYGSGSTNTPPST